MRVLVALGDNALLRRGEPADAQTQRENVRTVVAALAQIAEQHELVVTHGNGPLVGLLAQQGDAHREARPYPLDVPGAECEGTIGYLIDQELTHVLGSQLVATLLTQVLVDGDDPAFARPAKPVGPVYDRETARDLARERGWNIAADGLLWRRVVPSPEPQAVIELDTIRILLDAGVVVVCTGGGGIPVTLDDAGRLHGVEAVIDKDLAAALLARRLECDALLLLTDVPCVVDGWGGSDPRPVADATPAQLRALRLDAGSMGPKVEAACRFADSGGLAGIGALEDAVAILEQRAGTSVRAVPAASRITRRFAPVTLTAVKR